MMRLDNWYAPTTYTASQKKDLAPRPGSVERKGGASITRPPATYRGVLR